MMEKTKEQLFVLKLFLNKEFFIILGIYLVFATVFSVTALLFARFTSVKEIEIIIQQFVISLRGDVLTTALKIFTDLSGETAMILLVLLVAGVFFWKKRYLYSLGIVFSVGVAEVVSLIIKNLIGRERPPASLSLVVEHSPSFPSGHTIAAVAFYGFLIYVIYKNVHHALLRFFLMSLCGGMILLAGFTRIYLGVHWPGDVMASYILGGGLLASVIYLIEKRENTLEVKE